MRIGLLECDHVRPELTDIAGDYREMFPALFSRVVPNWEFRFYDVCNGQFPESPEACEVYICTGSKFSVYDQEEWILRLKSFVREIHAAGKYYIGVCFGHQMLGEALGGKVEKSPRGWCVGMHSFDIIKKEAWMQPEQATVNLLMMCQDQVMQMPPDSVLLAQTPDCPVGMFRVGDKMLGIQAHPEFTKEYDKALMELRVERIGEQKLADGIRSLDMPEDEITFIRWVENFVKL